MTKISVILPCYNEEKRITESFKEILSFSDKNPEYEFIFVDDGSTDKTYDLLQSEINKSKDKKIRVVSYQNNRGKGSAVRTGIKHTDGDLICFTDSDLAYPLEHLEKLKEKLDKFDIVIGRRGLSKNNSNNVPLIRKIIGIGFNILSRIILNLKFKDMQAGIKGFRKDAAKKLFENQKINDFSFDTELLYLGKKYGYKVGEIPAEISDNNSYKISKVNIIKDSAKMFFSLFRIRLNDIRGKYD